jgi:hypothetical protein
VGYRRRQASTGKTIAVILVVVLCVAIIAAFKGVQPLAAYKDIIVKSIGAYMPPISSTQSIQKPTIATTESIYAEAMFHDLCIVLKPTDRAKANYQYKLDLFKNGKLVTTWPVTWNQPEIDVKHTKVVRFSLTQQEFDAYFGHRLDDIFSVKVYE